MRDKEKPKESPCDNERWHHQKTALTRNCTDIVSTAACSESLHAWVLWDQQLPAANEPEKAAGMPGKGPGYGKASVNLFWSASVYNSLGDVDALKFQLNTPTQTWKVSFRASLSASLDSGLSGLGYTFLQSIARNIHHPLHSAILQD